MDHTFKSILCCVLYRIQFWYFSYVALQQHRIDVLHIGAIFLIFFFLLENKFFHTRPFLSNNKFFVAAELLEFSRIHVAIVWAISRIILVVKSRSQFRNLTHDVNKNKIRFHIRHERPPISFGEFHNFHFAAEMKISQGEIIKINRIVLEIKSRISDLRRSLCLNLRLMSSDYTEAASR